MEERILVIEPDEAMQERVKNALPKAHVVIAEPYGTDVIAEAAKKGQPDLILMDVQLPRLDGFQICQQLLVHPEMRHIPVLYVSAPSAEVPESLVEYGVIPADAFDTLGPRVTAAVTQAQMERTVREAVAAATAAAPDDSADLTQSEVDVLRSGGFDPDAKMNFEPLAKGAAKYQALLASSLTVAEAAQKLGVSTGRVRQRLLSEHPSLYGIRKGNEWRLPAFQFGRKELVPNIENVILKLDRDLDPVAVEGWFNRPNIDLEQEDRNVSPLEWLAQGKQWEPVAELAEDL